MQQVTEFNEQFKRIFGSGDNDNNRTASTTSGCNNRPINNPSANSDLRRKGNTLARPIEK